MKTISRHVWIAVLTATTIAYASVGEETFPTIAEIDAEIASLANQRQAKTAWFGFVPNPRGQAPGRTSFLPRLCIVL